ncbi:MAG TPA: DUF192 domain-containing protein [Candidatus Nanoarchaeia archaeon]|nr:DUF192 domain-containing protein [Candidatus Nanoarchaeia archaeon]
MKKLNIILIILFGLMIISGVLACLFSSFSKTNALDISFSGQPNFIIHAEAAITPAQLTRGLMFRQSMPADSGMLFIFPQESIRSFWMKNTLIPLDMIFISADDKIVDIKSNFQPCTADPCPVYQSAAPAKYVLEVKAGIIRKKGIAIGDKLTIHN